MSKNEQCNAVKSQIKLLIEHNLKLDWQYRFESQEKREERWLSALDSLLEAVNALMD